MNSTTSKLVVPVVLLVMALGLFMADQAIKKWKSDQMSVGSGENSEVLPNKKVGYIIRMYERDGNRYLDFDEVQLLTAEAGTCRSSKGGNPNAPACGPDGYLIVNINNQISNWEVVTGSVGMKDSSQGQGTMDYDNFSKMPPEQFQKSLFEIQLVKEKVVKITEELIL